MRALYFCHPADFLIRCLHRICLNHKKINVSTVLADHTLGINEVNEGIWLASFMHYHLGYCRLEPLENPFGPKVLPMSPE